MRKKYFLMVDDGDGNIMSIPMAIKGKLLCVSYLHPDWSVLSLISLIGDTLVQVSIEVGDSGGVDRALAIPREDVDAEVKEKLAEETKRGKKR